MIRARKGAGREWAFPLPDSIHGEDSASDGSEVAAPSTSRGTADPGALVEVVGSGSRLDRVLWATSGALRKHWLLALLLAAGLVLRAVAQVGYEPALLFI